MKNSSRLRLGFFILLSALLVTRCTKYDKPANPAVKQIPKTSDGLIFVKDESSNTTFYMSGKEIGDIAKVQVVGVQHTNADETAGVNAKVLPAYEMFWDLYLKGSNKDPGSITMALEMGVEASPNAKLGNEYRLNEPTSLVTPWMFKKGLRKVRISDPRIKTPALFALHQKSLNLFTERGGVVNTSASDSRGFPVVVMTREPALTQEDLSWLKNEWYPKCFLPDREFENIIWSNCLNGDVAVVGAAHAFRIEKEYGARIALIVSDTTLVRTAFSLAYNSYYLSVIGKDK
mgnify:CR=1 FL=1